MNEFEVEMKFKNEPRLTVYKKARTSDGARFAAILEASMNGFDVNVVEFINIKKMK
jgi:hypothetical protein